TYLNASLARIWIFDRAENVLRLQASAGAINGVEQTPRELPAAAVDIARLLEGKAILINDLLGEAPMPDKEWARREGMVAFAGYPLMLEDRLVGLMGVCARTHLSQATLQEMASVANGIALCIERKRSEEALESSQVQYRSVVENIKEVIFQTDDKG